MSKTPLITSECPANVNHPHRNNMLRSIKESSEKDINAFKAAKEREYQEEY